MAPVRLSMYGRGHSISKYRGDPLYYGTGAVNRYGILYPSRNNYPASSVALFDRASAKVGVVIDIDLAAHVAWPAFVHDYQIGIVP